MSVFTLEYKTVIKPKLEAALSDALKNEVAKVLTDEAEKSAKENVYDAHDPIFDSRRYSFLKDNSYYTEVNGNAITITATAHLQNLWNENGNYDDPSELSDIVELGIVNYYMPFARPWLDKAIENGLANGRIDAAIEAGLKRQGF